MNEQAVKYNHPEAFCLMHYQDEVTKEIEVLWNSRDGVTPFIIKSRAGNEAHHVDWQKDRRDPRFIPTPGMRIFVDASPKHAHIRESAKDYVETHWHTMQATNELFARMTKDEAINHFITSWTQPGAPTIVEAE